MIYSSLFIVSTGLGIYIGKLYYDKYIILQAEVEVMKKYLDGMRKEFIKELENKADKVVMEVVDDVAEDYAGGWLFN